MHHRRTSSNVLTCTAFLFILAPACKADKEYQEATRAACVKIRECHRDKSATSNCERSRYDSGPKFWNHDIAIACRACLDTINCEQFNDYTRPVCEQECPSSIFPEPGPEAPVAHLEMIQQNPCRASVFGEESGIKPRYVGMPGWIRAEPGKNPANKPWTIPTLKQVGPEKWEENPDISLLHKTPVTVIEQEIEHRGHGFYAGRLTVRATESGESFVIRSSAFSATPYWKCPDALSTRLPGPILAQTSRELRAVDRHGRWVNLESGQDLLCDGAAAPRQPKGAEGMLYCARVVKKRGTGESVFVPADGIEVLY